MAARSPADSRRRCGAALFFLGRILLGPKSGRAGKTRMGLGKCSGLRIPGCFDAGARERGQLPRPDGPRRQRSGPTKIGVVLLVRARSRQSKALRGSKLAIGLPAAFIRVGLADRSSPEYLTDRLGANPDGVLAEYAVFNEEAVVAPPSHLSFEGAATCRPRR
jgi:hypothetical protein